MMQQQQEPSNNNIASAYLVNNLSNEGEHVAEESKSHRKMGRTCSYNDCNTQASFKFPTEKDRVFCAKHKVKGMLDYRSRKCEHADCTTIASFNFYGLKKRRYCKIHAEPGMLVLEYLHNTFRDVIPFIMFCFATVRETKGNSCYNDDKPGYYFG